MFMTPAIVTPNKNAGSGLGSMHLNALNGSASINADSEFGPSNFVNDEHLTATFFENFKYYPKDTLKSPAVRRSRASSPLPLPVPVRSKVKSPYLPRKNTKCHRYEADKWGGCDDSSDINMFKSKYTRNHLEVKVNQALPEFSSRNTCTCSKSSDMKDAHSLNFDSLSLHPSPCKENVESKRASKSACRSHTH